MEKITIKHEFNLIKYNDYLKSGKNNKDYEKLIKEILLYNLSLVYSGEILNLKFEKNLQYTILTAEI